MQDETTGAMKIPSVIGRYKVIRTIAKGYYSVVVLAADSRTEDIYAIKVLDRRYITKLQEVYHLENELRFCTRFNHPNLIKIYDVIYEEDFISVVMEYAVNGDIQTYITSGVKLGIDEQLRIAHDLIHAIQYLHERGVSHRDINPTNILLDSSMTPKLIDFGFSKETTFLAKTCCGLPCYIAPEVYDGKKYDPMKADIWSLGVTLHLIATCEFPWTEKSGAQMSRSVRSRSLHMDIKANDIMGTIIRCCLQFDPFSRPSAEELEKMIGERRHEFRSASNLQNLKASKFPRIHCMSIPSPVKSAHMNDFIFANAKPLIKMRSYKDASRRI